MRIWFWKTSAAGKTTDADVAVHVHSQRIGELSQLNVELTRANVELSREVIRLSQRQNPVITDEVIEDPPTTRDADMREARRGEQLQAPAVKGRHGL